MDYFVVQITKEKDAEVYATLVTPKSTQDEAEMLWHQTCASVLANTNIDYAQIYVDDYNGNKKWMKVILPEPKPEPNEE